MSAYDTVRQMLEEARRTKEASRQYSRQCADIIVDDLRELLPSQLKKIKLQLRNFNAHTGEWKK